MIAGYNKCLCDTIMEWMDIYKDWPEEKCSKWYKTHVCNVINIMCSCCLTIYCESYYTAIGFCLHFEINHIFYKRNIVLKICICIFLNIHTIYAQLILSCTVYSGRQNIWYSSLIQLSFCRFSIFAVTTVFVPLNILERNIP